MNVYIKDMKFNEFIAHAYILSEMVDVGERHIFLNETNNIYLTLRDYLKQSLLDVESYNRISFHMNLG